MAKFIVVTGGVVSGLGKGITTASIGLILKSSGYSVDAIKFDPYLNIDPGTMSPYEHGEVYVLDDGSETDLDLGHYERFLKVNLTKNSSVTAGKIYDAILTKEREGEYLGKNVQLIPNVTNYIKDCLIRGLPKNHQNHVRLIEIGGSTGDMEGQIFLESFRQFKAERKEEVAHIHLGYVPYLHNSGEYKTKPLQTSVRELLSSGLQPDVIVARYHIEPGHNLSQNILDKIALFSNLPGNRVVSLPDLDSIYQVPLHLEDSKILPILEEFMGYELKFKLPQFFQKTTENNSKKTVKIGLVAKYPKLTDAYLSLTESLKIAGAYQDLEVEISFIDAELLSLQNDHSDKIKKEWKKLESVQSIIIPGGFGTRGMEGKILAAKFARENKIPFLGICLGLQMAVIEFSRNVLGLKTYSREMFEDHKTTPKDKEFIIDLIPEQAQIHRKGGTMRLGGYDCTLESGTLAKKLFKKEKIRERHRHRLEVQSQYIAGLEKAGMKISGKHWYKDKNGKTKFLVELIELDQKTHPYFIATQSHPEFLSRPDEPHPLFRGLVEATVKIKTQSG